MGFRVLRLPHFPVFLNHPNGVEKDGATCRGEGQNTLVIKTSAITSPPPRQGEGPAGELAAALNLKGRYRLLAAAASDKPEGPPALLAPRTMSRNLEAEATAWSSPARDQLALLAESRGSATSATSRSTRGR